MKKHSNIKWRHVYLSAGMIAMGLIASYFVFSKQNYYKTGENAKFQLKPGQVFKITLDENGSTGFSTCWINVHNCIHVKLMGRDYDNSLNAQHGYVGAGGLLTFTFKAIDRVRIPF